MSATPITRAANSITTSNGFLVTPAQIGDGRGYNYNVNYFGYNGDGHFGRVNLTASTYFAIGHQDHNQFSGPPNSGQTIASYFAAVEPSMDFDWFRVRLSGLFASGDNNPQGGRCATGFDAIFENPQFAGADSSSRLDPPGHPLHRRRRRLADAAERRPRGILRSSKDEGQTNWRAPIRGHRRSSASAPISTSCPSCGSPRTPTICASSPRRPSSFCATRPTSRTTSATTCRSR